MTGNWFSSVSALWLLVRNFQCLINKHEAEWTEITATASQRSTCRQLKSCLGEIRYKSWPGQKQTWSYPDDKVAYTGAKSMTLEDGEISMKTSRMQQYLGRRSARSKLIQWYNIITRQLSAIEYTGIQYTQRPSEWSEEEVDKLIRFHRTDEFQLLTTLKNSYYFNIKDSSIISSRYTVCCLPSTKTWFAKNRIRNPLK